MAKTVAVVIDAGFLEKELKPFRRKSSSGRIEARHIQAVAEATIEENEELFRIYYYHCPPYMSKQSNPFTEETVDFGTTAVARYQTMLQNSVRLSPRFAFRMGILKFRGWRCSASDVKDRKTTAKELTWKPHFEQKQVAIKIGLDMAWLASKRIVDIISIVSGDTDFVPAMKFVRREGLQIRLVVFKHWNHGGHDNLVEHSDFIKTLDLGQIIHDAD